MMDTQPYYTDAIFLRMGAREFLNQDVMHYFALVRIEGLEYLIPTQGKVIRMRETSEGSIYAHFRFHRKPTFFLVRYDGPILPLGDKTPEDVVAQAEALARDMVVFDRRHARIDRDFPTPGKSSDAIEAIEPLIGYARGS